MSDAYIYALRERFDCRIRYIGKTDNLRRRLRDHLRDKSVCHRTNWIRSVLARNSRIEIVILDRVRPFATWQAYERMWIEHAILECWPITNGTNGGDGVDGLCAEAKEKIRRTWIGRKHRPDSLLKIGAASRGRKHTEAYKQMMRKKMSVRVFTPEHRERLSATQHRRIPAAKAAEIRQRLADGERVNDVARAVGVHRMTVSRIKNNRKN